MGFGYFFGHGVGGRKEIKKESLLIKEDLPEELT